MFRAITCFRRASVVLLADMCGFDNQRAARYRQLCSAWLGAKLRHIRLTTIPRARFSAVGGMEPRPWERPTPAETYHKHAAP
jgi:hypothetical protein